MQRHGSLFEKLLRFGQIDDLSCFFTNWATFCNLLLKGSSKNQNMVVWLKSCIVFAKSIIFGAFSRNEAVFWNFFLKSSWKCQDMVVCYKSCKFCQIHGFSCFFKKWGTFCNFFLKSWSKCKDMVVCSKSCKVFAKSMIFRAFSRIEQLSTTFCWKVHRKTKTW